MDESSFYIGEASFVKRYCEEHNIPYKGFIENNVANYEMKTYTLVAPIVKADINELISVMITDLKNCQIQLSTVPLIFAPINPRTEPPVAPVVPVVAPKTASEIAPVAVTPSLQGVSKVTITDNSAFSPYKSAGSSADPLVDPEKWVKDSMQHMDYVAHTYIANIANMTRNKPLPTWKRVQFRVRKRPVQQFTAQKVLSNVIVGMEDLQATLRSRCAPPRGYKPAYRCDLCQRVYTRIENLHIHQSEKHSTEIQIPI